MEGDLKQWQLKLGINGFGRIGRNVLRTALDDSESGIRGG